MAERAVTARARVHVELGDGAAAGGMTHCGRIGSEERHNALEIAPAPGTAFDLERSDALRRGTLTSSSCGVCGRRSIDDLLARCRPLAPGPQLPLSLLTRSIA